ncbi:MAG: YncE family protein [Deltaproteobacteria bacterium]|nr:YncE family protein [Deltaproteobacteria bacterium]MCW5805455.1 YncE family protein [Deltaproteobacteria bacterium]
MRTAFVLACVSGLAGCTASAEEVRPPTDKLFFPTGAAIAPNDSVLFVANANSELRFDSGSVSVFDVALVDQVANDWATTKAAPGGCVQDRDRTETLICPSSVFLSSTRDAGARIGNFATDISVQDLGGGNLRLIIPTRGDPSIAWVDWNGTSLTCNTATAEGFAICDDDHRLSFIGEDTATQVALPEEPFGVYADTKGEFAIVSHLTTGAVTLIDSPKQGSATIADVVVGVFFPDPVNGLRGATGVAGNAASDIVYVGSRSEDRIQTFTVGRPVNGARPYLLQGNYFFLDSIGGTTGGGNDSRGMAFSKDGSRLYLVNRRPPTLQVYDTSPNEQGFPRNEPIGAADICRNASTVAVSGTGEDERIYVSCFQDGTIYVVDPRGIPSTEDIITIGRGPYQVVAANSGKKVYVTNFLEDTLAVIDTEPGSPTRNRVVLRIGIPRPL